jgi:hypothetical protein
VLIGAAVYGLCVLVLERAYVGKMMNLVKSEQ